MKKNDKIKKIIAEAIKETYEELGLDQIDMPIKDKGLFGMEDALGIDNEDDLSDIVAKYAPKSDDYEGGYEDDKSISPGYFNEMDEIDPISAEKTSAKSKHDFVADAIEYAGEDNWNMMSDEEQSQIVADIERDFDRHFSNEGKVVKITQSQLQKIIKEGVKQLHKKTMLEGRLEQINNELNMLSNPEAWEEARQKAQDELEKQNINWTQITDRPSGLINEGLTEKGKMKVQQWIEENGHRGAAKKMVDAMLIRKIGMTSSDLPDTVTFANGLDTIEGFLIAGEIDNAFDHAKETADEMISEEGGGMFFESSLEEKKYSDNAQDFISAKIRKLKDEGKPQDQAVAIAINMAREKGMKVPAEPKK